jgi:hypothetical protein
MSSPEHREKISQRVKEFNARMTKEEKKAYYSFNKERSRKAAEKLASLTKEERKIFYDKRAIAYKATISTLGYITPPQPIQFKKGKRSYYNSLTLEQGYFLENLQPSGWILGRPAMKNLKKRKEYTTKGVSREKVICRLRDKKEMDLFNFHRWP